MAIKVNEMNFTIRVTPEAVVQSKLLPGSRVILTYALNDIEWI